MFYKQDGSAFCTTRVRVNNTIKILHRLTERDLAGSWPTHGRARKMWVTLPSSRLKRYSCCVKIAKTKTRRFIVGFAFALFVYLSLVYASLTVQNRAGKLCDRLIQEDGPVVARVETMNWLRHQAIVRKIVVTEGDDIGVYYWSGIAGAIRIRNPARP